MTASPSLPVIAFPHTSSGRYLSGRVALHLPDPEGNWGYNHVLIDWQDGLAWADFAGHGPEAFVNTNSLLGARGIYDSAAFLRKIGVPLADRQPVYCANHTRAVLDILIAYAREGKTYDAHYAARALYSPKFVDTDAAFARIEQEIAYVLPKLPAGQANFLRGWIVDQYNAHDAKCGETWGAPAGLFRPRRLASEIATARRARRERQAR